MATFRSFISFPCLRQSGPLIYSQKYKYAFDSSILEFLHHSLSHHLSSSNNTFIFNLQQIPFLPICISSTPSSASSLSALSHPQPSTPPPPTQRATTPRAQVAKPPKSPRPFKPPSAPTTPVSLANKLSPSSSKTTNTTKATVLLTEPVPPTPVPHPLRENCLLGATTGLSTGATRVLPRELELLVSRALLMELVGVRTQTASSSMEERTASRWMDGWMVKGGGGEI